MARTKITARKSDAGTFLHVRLQQLPGCISQRPSPTLTDFEQEGLCSRASDATSGARVREDAGLHGKVRPNGRPWLQLVGSGHHLQEDH